MKTMNTINPLVRLPENEVEKFKQIIRKKRNRLILSPKDTIAQIKKNHAETINALLKEGRISETIVKLRELAYDDFLQQENIFNGEILKEIANIFNSPREMLHIVSNELYSLSGITEEVFHNKLNQLFGVYSGYISPYIYQLCLSNTQSRRSRAGKVFEGIIYLLYDYFNYPYESQKGVGRKAFSDLHLGKMVDSVLPGVDSFGKSRRHTIIGSMKTTLRERWQEVVEEIGRSNVPGIYLLTVDEDISEKKVKQIGMHNITLVVLNSVKVLKKMKNEYNVIDFETYFNKDIPEVLNHWK